MYILTEKNNLSNPVIKGKGFNLYPEYEYKFKVLNDNGGETEVTVIKNPDIPSGYEDKVQAVPVDIFLNHVSTTQGLSL